MVFMFLLSKNLAEVIAYLHVLLSTITQNHIVQNEIFSESFFPTLSFEFVLETLEGVMTLLTQGNLAGIRLIQQL